MKNIILSALFLVSLSAFSNTRECTFQDIQKLNEASGPKSLVVQQLLSQETPNFTCAVTTKNFMFPQDCGRFVFSELTFNITSGASNLKAVVQAGKISCTNERRNVLKSVKISE